MAKSTIARRIGATPTIPPKPFIPGWLQQVTYVGSSGTQYIDTGVKSNDAFNDIQITMTDFSTQSNKCFFGADSSTNNGTGMRFYSSGSSNTVAKLHGHYVTKITTGDLGTGNVSFRLFEDEGDYYLQTVSVIKNLKSSTSDVSNNIFIFSVNRSGSSYLPASIKVTNFIIKNGDTVIREYIPAYAKSAHVAYKGTTQVTCAAGDIGLYDRAEEKFYINSGTGTFTKGTDCKRLYLYNQGDECMHVTGGWLIRRGISEKEDDYMVILGNYEDDCDTLYTANVIELSSYTKFGIEYAVWSTSNDWIGAYLEDAELNIISIDSPTQSDRLIREFAISDLPSDQVFVGSDYTDIAIYRVWFE